MKFLNIRCAYCDAPILPEIERPSFTDAHAAMVKFTNLHICPVRDAELLRYEQQRMKPRQ